MHHGIGCEEAKVQRKRLEVEEASALEEAEYHIVEKGDAPRMDYGRDWDEIELDFEDENLGA